MMRCFRNKGF